MFSIWVTNAKAKYPEYGFQIREVGIIKDDLKSAIIGAAKSLVKEEKESKRKIQGYDYGYFCGFIEGNLNAQWHSEYIYKQTNDFKVMTVISTLKSFLKFDDLLSIRLSRLYDEFFNNQVNIEEINNRIFFESPKSLDFLEINQVDNPILASLDKIKIDLLVKRANDSIPDFLNDVKPFFSKDDVREIVDLF